MKTISAGDANRHFLNLLHELATGEVITVLSHGKPVATISPARSVYLMPWN
jgi:prevent-host-death family protein